jgi:hypothetical protein
VTPPNSVSLFQFGRGEGAAVRRLVGYFRLIFIILKVSIDVGTIKMAGWNNVELYKHNARVLGKEEPADYKG